MMALRGRRSHPVREIQPEEIFLDSSNLPHLDESQFEGRVEHPVSHLALLGVGVMFALGVIIFFGRAFSLEAVHGTAYAEVSRENRLSRSIIFASRGIIYDRNGRAVASNEVPLNDSQSESSGEHSAEQNVLAASSTPFAFRHYIALPGLSNLIGFVRYPKQDDSGAWWREEYAGASGVELTYDARLRGENGSRLIESDARGKVEREHIVIPPRTGSDIHLTIDADVESTLYSLLFAHAREQGFEGGASVIMDVKTGDILALTSFPEYDHAAFAAGNASAIRALNSDPHTPLLNRALSGLYAPGSIVKPIFAAGALNEGIIRPDTQIESTGQLVVPNPYDAAHPSIFKDWKPLGWLDMKHAIAVSSDQYFYTIGGGFGSQQGLGIARLDAYARLFGLGSKTGIALSGEQDGVVPTPEWKEHVFGKDDPWRIGDTYHTAIGQYGFQITPLQAVRYIAAIAHGGSLVTPKLTEGERVRTSFIGISEDKLQVIREGMRMAVSSESPDRTARALDMGGITIAGKTGTAQVGEHNQWMNSWSVGFWPAGNPRFAFATVLERAPAGTLSGAAPAMRPFFDWLVANKPEYVQ